MCDNINVFIIIIEYFETITIFTRFEFTISIFDKLDVHIHTRNTRLLLKFI